jgi:acetyltransferase-like isoleucine patch superfamily enzyme
MKNMSYRITHNYDYNHILYKFVIQQTYLHAGNSTLQQNQYIVIAGVVKKLITIIQLYTYLIIFNNSMLSYFFINVRGEIVDVHNVIIENNTEFLPTEIIGNVVRVECYIGSDQVMTVNMY